MLVHRNWIWCWVAEYNDCFVDYIIQLYKIDHRREMSFTVARHQMMRDSGMKVAHESGHPNIKFSFNSLLGGVSVVILICGAWRSSPRFGLTFSSFSCQAASKFVQEKLKFWLKIIFLAQKRKISRIGHQFILSKPWTSFYFSSPSLVIKTSFMFQIKLKQCIGILIFAFESFEPLTSIQTFFTLYLSVQRNSTSSLLWLKKRLEDFILSKYFSPNIHPRTIKPECIWSFQISYLVIRINHGDYGPQFDIEYTSRWCISLRLDNLVFVPFWTIVYYL